MPIQFKNVLRKPYGPEVQWDACAAQLLYFKFHERIIYKKITTLFSNSSTVSCNQCISHNPAEVATGYTQYAFELTDCPIWPNTYSTQTKSAEGSVRLEMAFTVARIKTINVNFLYQILENVTFDHYLNVIFLSAMFVDLTLKKFIIWPH